MVATQFGRAFLERCPQFRGVVAPHEVHTELPHAYLHSDYTDRPNLTEETVNTDKNRERPWFLG